MIYYLSGTGNSKWVAQTIANNIGVEAVSVFDDRVKNLDKIECTETTGFVFPIYAWYAPEIVVELMKKVHVPDGIFTFGIATCQSEIGNTFKKLSKIIRLDSKYSLSMPTNYITGEMDSEELIKKKISKAKIELEKMSKEIIEKQIVKRYKKGILAALKSSYVNKMFNKYSRNTESFFVEQSCTGCQACVKNCQLGTITIVDGKPVWGKECMQCFACINKCPKQAIQYGNKTKNKERYYFKNEA